MRYVLILSALIILAKPLIGDYVWYIRCKRAWGRSFWRSALFLGPKYKRPPGKEYWDFFSD